MDYQHLEQLSGKWDDMTYAVIELKDISRPNLQALLKDTYLVLREFSKAELVPKEITKILLNMEEYLYFASVIEANEDKKDFYCFKYVSMINKALKKGFFEADYGCDFPKLKVVDDKQGEFVIDFETDIFAK